jgi:hypothetical protein
MLEYYVACFWNGGIIATIVLVPTFVKFLYPCSFWGGFNIYTDKVFGILDLLEVFNIYVNMVFWSQFGLYCLTIATLLEFLGVLIFMQTRSFGLIV